MWWFFKRQPAAPELPRPNEIVISFSTNQIDVTKDQFVEACVRALAEWNPSYTVAMAAGDRVRVLFEARNAVTLVKV